MEQKKTQRNAVWYKHGNFQSGTESESVLGTKRQSQRLADDNLLEIGQVRNRHTKELPEGSHVEAFLDHLFCECLWHRPHRKPCHDIPISWQDVIVTTSTEVVKNPFINAYIQLDYLHFQNFHVTPEFFYKFVTPSSKLLVLLDLNQLDRVKTNQQNHNNKVSLKTAIVTVMGNMQEKHLICSGNTEVIFAYGFIE